MDRNKAIEIIKSYCSANEQMLNEALETLIPEIFETEDEKIKKEIINYFECQNRDDPTRIGPHYKWIEWLKKQGNINKDYYEIAEKEKYDFVNGQFIECRKSFDEFKEDTSYWFEYVGNDTYIGRSDNILGKKFHITPRQLYSLFTQQHCPQEDHANEGTNAPTEYGKYVDDCLNEAAKHYFSEGEDKYSVADLFYAGVRCGQSWFEKQSSNILWHNVSEEPEEQREILCKWNSGDALWHDVTFYHADTKTFWDGGQKIEDVIMWAYIDETFEKQDEEVLVATTDEKQGIQPRYSIGDVLRDKSYTAPNKDEQPTYEVVNIKNGLYICNGLCFPISLQDEYELVAKKVEQKPTMTLDEAIAHCKEKACGNSTCAFQHKQLAQWLTELKEYKEQKSAERENLVDIPFGTADSELIEETITIPDGYVVIIEDNKVHIKKEEFTC